MGDRAQVRIVGNLDHAVYLYTHWTGSTLPETVRNALDRGRDHWDNPSYLARIIFCEMVKGDVDGTTGFGIDTAEHGDTQHSLITVDCRSKTVTIGPSSWTMDAFIAWSGCPSTL